MPLDRAGDVAAALRQLADRFPVHPNLLALRDAGVADGTPYVVYDAVGGDPLDVALRNYGPADIQDALPRLRHLARALDVAATHGVSHGALTPAEVIVSADHTFVSGVGLAGVLQGVGCGTPVVAPYSAPEVTALGAREPASDEFALAAIAYEWLFGRQMSSLRDVEVPALPGVDSSRMRSVFARALSHEPELRFPSCSAFIEALDATTRPAASVATDLDDLPIHPAATPVERAIVHAAPRFFSSLPAEPAPLTAAATSEPSSTSSSSGSRAVLVAAVLGAVAVGAFFSWRFAGDRSPEASADTRVEGQAFTEAPLPPAAKTPAPVAEAPVVRAPEPPPVATSRRDDAAPVRARGADVARVAQVDAGLLVHSIPAGATVAIDGVEQGVTPVAVRGLALGTRTVVVTRPGYRSAQRQVTLTSDRPSRALEVALVQVAPATPAPTAAARDGVLVVDSRPAGATVTIDGRPAGQTPLTVPSIAAGPHTVRIERTGYRPVTSTVIVAAGQRARVAARLEGGQEEE